jgi:Uma2 family endonuclease
MNAETLERPLTYEEERGKPMPSYNHGVAQANLIIELARKNPDFRLVSELTIELEGAPYTPDLSIYSKQPVDWRHDEIRRTDPPLTAVEIFSPTQGYQNIMEKVSVYLRNGVKSCWLISPHLKTITIIGADGQEHTFSSGSARDPYTGLSAELGAVFA